MIKLPRTRHIEGSRLPLREVDPEAEEFLRLKEKFLVIEEKVDGTGVSLSFDDELEIQIGHRGHIAIGKEFTKLYRWADSHKDRLFDLLGTRYVLFGEWMLHKHTIFYDKLPHLFLESDIYDQENQLWLSTFARDQLLIGHSDYIKRVPVISAFKPSSLNQIVSLIRKSKFQSEKWQEALQSQCHRMNQSLDKILKETDCSELMEGLYIKHEDDKQVIARYKYVRYEFVKLIVNMGSHLIDREPVYNTVLGGHSDWL